MVLSVEETNHKAWVLYLNLSVLLSLIDWIINIEKQLYWVFLVSSLIMNLFS